MTSDADRERQLDAILSKAEGNADMLPAASREIREHDTILEADLHLLARLRTLEPARQELDDARLRVGQRLTREVLAAPGEAEPWWRPFRELRLSEPPKIDPPTTAATPAEPTPMAVIAPPARRANRRAILRRLTIATAAAAVLLVAFVSGISALSAQSLPESPLYGVKRAEEAALLSLPMDNNARAETIGMIAQRRLSEAAAESNAHRNREALSLLNQYTSAVHQLISLAVGVSGQGGDTSVITFQIEQALRAAQVAQQSANQQGQTTFSQALTVTESNVTTSLQQAHVSLPASSGQTGTGDGHNQPTGTIPTPTSEFSSPTTTATPSATPQPTPTGNHGLHRHNGHGAGPDSTDSSSGG